MQLSQQFHGAKDRVFPPRPHSFSPCFLYLCVQPKQLYAFLKLFPFSCNPSLSLPPSLPGSVFIFTGPEQFHFLPGSERPDSLGRDLEEVVSWVQPYLGPESGTVKWSKCSLSAIKCKGHCSMRHQDVNFQSLFVFFLVFIWTDRSKYSVSMPSFSVVFNFYLVYILLSHSSPPLN